MVENFARQQRLLALGVIKNRDFRSPPAYPCPESRCIVKRQTLSHQPCTSSGENVAHSAAGHSRLPGCVIAQCPIAPGSNCSTAFEQKTYSNAIAEFSRRCRPR